jgi:hypothetical protein
VPSLLPTMQVLLETRYLLIEDIRQFFRTLGS